MEEAQELSELGVEWQWKLAYYPVGGGPWMRGDTHPKTLEDLRVFNGYPQRIHFRVRVSPET